MSQSKVLEFPSKHAEREYYMGVFKAYLQVNYRNPEHVATIFDVRFQTALNWWSGENCPGGIPVMKAMSDPRFIAEIIKRAA